MAAVRVTNAAASSAHPTFCTYLRRNAARGTPCGRPVSSFELAPMHPWCVLDHVPYAASVLLLLRMDVCVEMSIW
uniref:Uncharacterized protein n=1 Tax=Oryza nivara TaxID=4536 RepID=A0A0E0GZ43_ORYNI